MAAVDPAEDEAPPPRSARLVLVTPAGVVVGSLPAVPVSTPWWPDVEPVVRATRERRGVVVTVLRLLEAERSQPHGGEVAYLAETPEPVDAEPWRGRLRPHRLRQRYAEPGGPAADLAWAKSSLLQVGLVPLGRATQIRTWNLSSIWRIPTESETVWLKSVPPFFAHEGRLMSALARECVPAVLGFDAARMLLREAPGDDLHHADPSQLTDMVELLLGIQLDWRDRLDLLLSFGLPDWRGPALIPLIADVVSRTESRLSAEQREALAKFVERLPGRFADLAACGLPDTLVHGDFHPGNVRGEGRKLILLDWADSGIGHPLLDQSAFLERLPTEAVPSVTEFWARRWLDLLPYSNPARAAALIAPIAAARHAVIYRRFLDNIEPSEHPYHRSDPVRWLGRAVALLDH